MAATLIATPKVSRRVFGSGQVFFNNVYVGEGRNVVFNYAETSVYQLSGRPLRKRTKAVQQQEATLTFQAAEFSTANIRQALNAYQATTGAIFSRVDGVVVMLTGVVDSALGDTLICASPTDSTAATDAEITVKSLDGVTTYAGTDYDLTAATGMLKRTVASTIPDGGSVRVFYSFQHATAEVTNVGGKSSCLQVTEAVVKFVYQFENCDLMEITMHRASPSSGLNVTFDTENYSTRDLVFEALADPSRPPGFDLFSIAIVPAA